MIKEISELKLLLIGRGFPTSRCFAKILISVTVTVTVTVVEATSKPSGATVVRICLTEKWARKVVAAQATKAAESCRFIMSET